MQKDAKESIPNKLFTIFQDTASNLVVQKPHIGFGLFDTHHAIREQNLLDVTQMARYKQQWFFLETLKDSFIR